MYIQNQRFLVFGLSKSGIAAAELLLKYGAKTYILDDSKDELRGVQTLVIKGATDLRGKETKEILPLIDVVVLSPGVPIDHTFPLEARKEGKRIIGEFELGAMLCRSPIVAVTGTNGKTTTVSLVAKMLECEKTNCELVGNVGVPITSRIEQINKEATVCVAEVSSFQLETVYSFCPHIACILNITPDHLERHYTMENYCYLKGKILHNLTESEYAVLNGDDPNVSLMGANTKAKVRRFSLTDTSADAYLSERALYAFGEKIADEDEIKIKGKHNVQNALAAILIASLLGVNKEAIREALCSFQGAKHRIETVYSANGKDYVDDSKGTNTSSTICAIDAMTKPTVLILGGKEKGEDYVALFKKIKESNVVSVVLTGEARKHLLSAAAKCECDGVHTEPSFDNAVALADYLCPVGGVVLLSPACASFDSFHDYAERGDTFLKVVKGLANPPANPTEE